jgi:hypothetical protein
MVGAFGLIWDGEFVDILDDVYGSYLKYNYPHKLSLYLAAGLPVIAPKESAISSFIIEHRVGILINNLLELKEMNVGQEDYAFYKNNVATISDKIKTGGFFTAAVAEVETDILIQANNFQANTAYN